MNESLHPIPQSSPPKIKQWVCHTVALPFTLKSKYLKAKEELYMETQKYCTIAKI
jgi:hypothetical protein